MDCAKLGECCVEPMGIPLKAEGPVYILGKKYDIEQDVQQIQQAILTRIWCTYRKGFPPILDSGHTSDKGWGCMLRCGQMLLCEALMLTQLKENFVWTIDTKNPKYLDIIKKIEDVPEAPFSIHKIAEAGVQEGKKIGEWFGPNTIAQCLKNLAPKDPTCGVLFQVALDSCIIINEIKKNNMHWIPLVLIVPLRLGLQNMNVIYLNSIRKVLSLKWSLGIIGGTPNHALYFFGRIGDEVLFLDPHTTQQAGSIGNKNIPQEIGMDQTYHCSRAGRMKITSIDPSIAVCFYAKTESDFDKMIEEIKFMLVTNEKSPMLEVVNDRPKYKPPEEKDRTKPNQTLDGLEYEDSGSDFELI